MSDLIYTDTNQLTLQAPARLESRSLQLLFLLSVHSLSLECHSLLLLTHIFFWYQLSNHSLDCGSHCINLSVPLYFKFVDGVFLHFLSFCIIAFRYITWHISSQSLWMTNYVFKIFNEKFQHWKYMSHRKWFFKKKKRSVNKMTSFTYIFGNRPIYLYAKTFTIDYFFHFI